MHETVEPTFSLIPFETLRAVLVLGTKYDFERYKVMALDQLQILFPRTLSEWDATERLRQWYSGSNLALLELALSFGHHAMLPSAYYLCLSKTPVVRTSIALVVCVLWNLPVHRIVF